MVVKTYSCALTCLFFAVVLLAQSPQPAQNELVIQNPSQLVGKRINVQRLPLCEPGTYNGDLAHAGKEAVVLSAKPSNLPSIPQSAMNRLAPQMRETLMDQQKAATLLLKFDDGTTRDTCAPIGPKTLAGYIELAPGETLEAAPAVASPSPKNSVATGPDDLSPQEVAAAIGGSGRNDFVWIQDGDFQLTDSARTASITLFMPEAVLATKSESARRQYLSYVPDDEDRHRALTVVAEGYVPSDVRLGCQSITRIVLLSDLTGNVVRESYFSEPVDETWRNAFGTSNVCESLRAKFSMSDVEQVRAAAKDGEFYIAVFSGDVKVKAYKIKHKHQSKLGLDAQK